jgi:hypothetical protein
MVWHREIAAQQPDDRGDQPFRLAQREAEQRPERQRRQNSQ